MLAPTADAQSERTISVAGEASLTARNNAARVGFGVSAVRATRRAALDATSLEVRGGKLLMAGVANTAVGVDERHVAEVDKH